MMVWRPVLSTKAWKLMTILPSSVKRPGSARLAACTISARGGRKELGRGERRELDLGDPADAVVSDFRGVHHLPSCSRTLSCLRTIVSPLMLSTVT